MPSLRADEFIHKLEKEPAFRSEIGITSANISLEEFQAKTEAAGYSYSQEEILAAIKAQNADTLTDEDLDQVTGGTDPNGKTKAPDGPHIYLVFQFKLVAVKTIS